MTGNASIVDRLHDGLSRLAQLSPDGVAEQNEVGFSGATLGPGLKLLQAFPRWELWQVDKAIEICTIHRGQLGIDSTQLREQFNAEKDSIVADLEKAKAEAAEVAAAEIEAAKSSDEPFGLTFSAWRNVTTKHGETKVRSATPTEAFWTAWRANKQAVKDAGFGLGKSYRTGEWEVTQWGTPKPTTVAPEVPWTPAPPIGNVSGLLPYQPDATANLVHAIRNYGAAVDASDTGTGKTYTALAAMRELGLSPVVVCPKSVMPSWKRAADHLGVKLAGVVNYELVRRGSTGYGKWIGEGKSERFQWADTSAIIFDEIHRCKGRDTQNAYLVRGARDQRIPTIGLSATLAHNPLEMRAIGHLCGLHNWGNFYPWCFRHGCSKGRFGITFNDNRQVLADLHHELFPRHGGRVRINDLGDLFPDTQIAAESYNLNGAAAEIDRINAAMQAEIRALHARSANDSSNPRAEILVAMLRARQHAELVKVPLFVELATDAVESGQNVAVFVCFRETLEAIVTRLQAEGINPATVIGGQDENERQAGIDAFQADTRHCLVAMIQAGGVGISLHDLHGNRPRAAFISPTWSAVELRQTLGRVHRAGGRTKSTQRIVFVAESVEEQVRTRVAAKLNRLDALNDGDLA